MAVNIKKEFWNGTEYKPISKIVFTSPNFTSPAVAGTRSHMQPGAKYMGTWYESVDWMYRQKINQDYADYPDEMESFFGQLTLTQDFNFDIDISANVTHNYKAIYTPQPSLDYVYKDKNNYCKISGSSSSATSSGISIRFDYPTGLSDPLFKDKANSIWWTCSGIGLRETLSLYISYDGTAEVLIDNDVMNTGKYSFVPTTLAANTAKLRLSYFDCYTVSSATFSVVNETITPEVPATASIPAREAKDEVKYKPFIPGIPTIPEVPPPANRLVTKQRVDAVYNNIHEFIGPMCYDSETETVYRFEPYGLFYFSKLKNRWLCLDPTPIGMGKGASIIKTKNNVYVITGKIEDTVTNQAGVTISNRRNLFMRYNLTDDEWIMLRPPPDTNALVKDFVFDTSLYTFNNSNEVYYRTHINGKACIYKYDCNWDAWSLYYEFPVSKTTVQGDVKLTHYGVVLFQYYLKIWAVSISITYSSSNSGNISNYTIELSSIDSNKVYKLESTKEFTNGSFLNISTGLNSTTIKHTELTSVAGRIKNTSISHGEFLNQVGSIDVLLSVCSRQGNTSELFSNNFVVFSILINNPILSLTVCNNYQSLTNYSELLKPVQVAACDDYFYIVKNTGVVMDCVSTTTTITLPGCNFHLQQGRLVLFDTKLYSIGVGYSQFMSMLDLTDPFPTWQHIGDSPFAPVTANKSLYLFSRNSTAPLMIPDYDDYKIYIVVDTDFLVFNTITNEWDTLTPTPFVIDNNFCGVKVGSFIYTLRGTDSSTFWKYDINENKWIVIHNFIAINIQYPVICYDMDSSYENRTATLSAGMFDTYNCSAVLNLLRPGTQYRYRIVSETVNGKEFGETKYFSTRPIVETQPTTFVSATSIALEGVVYSYGIPVECYFEYGTDATLLNLRTVSISLNTSEVVPLTVLAENLSPKTTYYYRLVGITVIGQHRGNLVAFTTDERAVTSVPENVTLHSATLCGTVVAENTSSTYYFYYGLTADYGNITTAKQSEVGKLVTVTEELVGLEPDTFYHYCIVVTTTEGILYGEDYVFRTLPQVELFAVTDKTMYSATLSGVIRTTGSVETGYYFQYGEDSVSDHVTDYYVTTENELQVSTTLSGLNRASIYNYRLASTTTSGTNYSNTLQFRTDLGVYTDLVATAGTYSATISGTVDSTISGTYNYFTYGVSAVDTYSTDNLNTYNFGNFMMSYLSNLSSDTTYKYRAITKIDVDGVYDYLYGDIGQFTTKKVVNILPAISEYYRSTVSCSMDSRVPVSSVCMEYTTVSGTYRTEVVDREYDENEFNFDCLLDNLPSNTEISCRLLGYVTSNGQQGEPIYSDSTKFFISVSGITTGVATDIRNDSAVVVGNYSSTVSGVAGHIIYGAPDMSYLKSCDYNGVTYATTLTDLAEDTDYSYRFGLTVSGGGVLYGETNSFRTLSQVRTVPNAYVVNDVATISGSIFSTVSGTKGYFIYGEAAAPVTKSTDYYFDGGDVTISGVISNVATESIYSYKVAYEYDGYVYYGNECFFYNSVPVITKSATNISMFKSDICGEVLNNQLNNIYYFEYGTTSACLLETPHRVITTLVGGVFESIDDLYPNTLYYYRMVLVTSGGQKYTSNILTFTTKESFYIGSIVKIDFDKVKVSAVFIPCKLVVSYNVGYNISNSNNTYDVLTTNTELTIVNDQAIIIEDWLSNLLHNTQYSYRFNIKYSQYNFLQHDVSVTFFNPTSTFYTDIAIDTGMVFDITPNSATFSGSVVQVDADSAYYFRYRDNASNIYETPYNYDLLSATIYTVNNLKDNTIYYCKFIKVTSTGSTEGSEVMFRTPSFVETGEVGSITACNATISGAVTPKDIDTSYYFQYGEVKDTLYAFNSYDPRIYKYSISQNDWSMVDEVLTDFMGKLSPNYIVDAHGIYLISDGEDYFIESGKSHTVIKYNPANDDINGHDLLPTNLLGVAFNKQNGLVYVSSQVVSTNVLTELDSYVLHYNLIPGRPAIPGTPDTPEVPYQPAVSYSPEIPGTPAIPAYSNYSTQLLPPTGWVSAPFRTTGVRILHMNLSFSEVVGTGIATAGTILYHQYSGRAVSSTITLPQSRRHYGENSIIFSISFGEAYNCRLTSWDDETHSTTDNRILSGEHYRVDAVAYRSNVVNTAHKPTFNSSRCLVYPQGNDVILKGNEKYYGDFDLIYSIQSGEYGEYLAFLPRMVGIDDSFVACSYNFVTTLHYQYT